MTTGYTAQDVATMLGLTVSQVRAYVRSGLVEPLRGDRGELLFSFRDLAVLRTAEGLVTERLPPRRIRQALQRVRDRLPDGQPLSAVQLQVEGDRVVVREGGARWHADSGQGLLA